MIQEVLRDNLRWMVDEDWALSPMFYRLLGMDSRAAEVQTLINDHLEARAAKKARRIERATRKAEAEAATATGAATTTEAIET